MTEYAATLYGINNTLYRAGTPVNEPHALARLRVIEDEYEFASTTVGQTVAMGVPIPAGMQLVGGFLYFDALATSTTIAVGNDTDNDEYLAATSTASAGGAYLNLIASMGEPFTTAEQVTVTLAGATATGTIKLVLFVAGY
uniref:Uncharacterized protein n=1 Tax=viral metagenome TaxID=1070528 RepID=A0A6H1ZVW3_9ZZZZ